MNNIAHFTAILLCGLGLLTGLHAQDQVLIPGGEFTMGKNSANPSDWQPEHRVRVDSFYLDRREVSNKDYFEFCKATGYQLPFFWDMEEFRCGMDFPEHPVVGVSFFDAQRYAEWKGLRLPTEAEWEYAARGGLDKASYPWGEGIDSTRANYGRKYSSSLPCASFPPNAYGLFDMGGNVWEWTTDRYGASYYSESPYDNPQGPGSGRFRVIRGGSWHSGAMCIQTYYRNGLSSSWLDFALGFRCARDM